MSTLALSRPDYTRAQQFALVSLRLLIGWHLLYEGVAKVLNPFWTSAGFLSAAEGPLRGPFLWLAVEPGRLALVDALNKWGLVLLGLALIVGLFTRFAAFAGAALLSLYYLANPPWLGIETSIPTEGSYLIVNKTLIELAALAVLVVFPTGHVLGLDSWFANRRDAR